MMMSEAEEEEEKQRQQMRALYTDLVAEGLVKRERLTPKKKAVSTSRSVTNSFDEEDFIDPKATGDALYRLYGCDMRYEDFDPKYLSIYQSLPTLASEELIVLFSPHGMGGYGLFTNRSFKQGELITLYGGCAIPNHSNGKHKLDDKDWNREKERVFKIRIPQANYHLDGHHWKEAFPEPYEELVTSQLALSPQFRAKYRPCWTAPFYRSIMYRGIGLMANHHTSSNAKLKLLKVDLAGSVRDIGLYATANLDPYTEEHTLIHVN